MNGTEKEDEPRICAKELFKYQNIASDRYAALDGLMRDGPRISVSMAYFMGTVDGKREERRRNKNRLKHNDS